MKKMKADNKTILKGDRARIPKTRAKYKSRRKENGLGTNICLSHASHHVSHWKILEKGQAFDMMTRMTRWLAVCQDPFDHI